MLFQKLLNNVLDIKVVLGMLLFLPTIALSQRIGKGYLLISYEYRHRQSNEGVKGALFLIDQDSLNADHLKLSPLWLRGYSDSSFSDCVNERTFDRLRSLMGNNISLDSPFANYFHEAQKMIKDKAKKVQKIKKNWTNGQREITIVSITPVLGKFCFLLIPMSGTTGYFSRVYIPLEPIYYDDQFWDSEKVRAVKGYDYSEIMYHRRFY